MSSKIMDKLPESKNICVSKDFVEIYKNFNVVSQVDKMKNLSKKELYLLLTVCLDKYPDDDPVVKNNMISFKDEIMEIFDIQDDKEPTNTFLIDLVEETGDKYIETDYIIYNDQPLPDILNKQEVRDAKIINIINEETSN